MNKLKKKTVPFTQIPNEILADKQITQEAVGIYVFMASKPTGWNFTIASMSRQIHAGQSKIRTCLTLLKNKGWIDYIKYSDGTGEYTINFTKVPSVENQALEKPSVENPNDGNPHVENPIMGNSTRINKKDLIVRKIDSKKDCIIDESTLSPTPKKLPAKKATKEPAPSTEVFSEYVLGMKNRYGKNVTPARNAKINKLLNNMIERIGLEMSLQVASNYPMHSNSWYVQNAHAVDFMVKDCESLSIQVQSGQMITKAGAYQADKQGHFKNQVQQVDNQYSNEEF